MSLSSHIKLKRYSETTECSFAHGLSSTYNLAKQILITLKSLRSFSVLHAVNYFTRSDGINQPRSENH